MMRLPPFDYLEPASVAEAVGLLTQHPRAAILAGGTDLLPNMKRHQTRPVIVVGLAAIPGLQGIVVGDDGGITIGALTLLRDVAKASELPAALIAASADIASPQIRNVATVGGNLCLDTRCGYINQNETWRLASGLCLKAGGDVCWVAPRGGVCVANSSSDLAPVVVALDAEVDLVGSDGERTLDAIDLFRPDGLSHLGKASDEIVTTLRLPPRPGWRSAYRKLRRRGSIDFPILGVAVAVQFGEDGTVEDARIVLGAVAPAPLRMREAEELLVGSSLGAHAIQEAADLVSTSVRPYDNADLGSRYRKWMVPIFVARALQDLT